MMTVSLDFFRDIWIPKENFFSPAELHVYLVRLKKLLLTTYSVGSVDDNEESKPVWIWKVGPEAENYYCDIDERVRFRVEGEIWHDPIPQKPILNDKGDLLVPDVGDDAVPYTVVVS